MTKLFGVIFFLISDIPKILIIINIIIIFQRRDSESGRGGGRGGGNRGGGPGGFDRMGGGPGGPRDFNDRNAGGRGGWDNNGRMGGPGDKTESTFIVPAAKCGVIIGRGMSYNCCIAL